MDTLQKREKQELVITATNVDIEVNPYFVRIDNKDIDAIIREQLFVTNDYDTRKVFKGNIVIVLERHVPKLEVVKNTFEPTADPNDELYDDMDDLLSDL